MVVLYVEDPEGYKVRIGTFTGSDALCFAANLQKKSVKGERYGYMHESEWDKLAWYLKA